MTALRTRIRVYQIDGWLKHPHPTARQKRLSPLPNVRASQTVAVSGVAGDTFVFSGWAKGDSVVMDEDEETPVRKFAIIGTFLYTDGTDTRIPC